MDLDRALAQLSDVHAQILRSEVFRGYRALPTAVTSGIALVAACLQTVVWPAATATEFVVAWTGVAALCAAICGADLWLRARRSRDVAMRVAPVFAQFLPVLVLGCVLTVALLRTASDALSMLPGFWAMATGVGIMASRPYLPRAIGFVALFYLVAGAMLIACTTPAAIPSPWTMGVTFGVGQALLALVLFRNLERPSRG